MSHPLDGIFASLARAESEIDELERAIDDFRATSHGIARDVDIQASHVVYRVVNVREVPADISVLIGSILHHMRGSLEHLVHALVKLNGKTPVKQNAFPVVREKFGDERRSKLKGLNTTQIAQIQALQPTNAPEICFYWLLVLHDLRIDAFHRDGLEVAAAFTFTASFPIAGIDFRDGEPIEVELPFKILNPHTHLRHPLQENDVLYEFDYVGELPDEDQLKPTIAIEIRTGEACKGGPLMAMPSTLRGIMRGLKEQVFIKPGLLDGFP